MSVYDKYPNKRHSVTLGKHRNMFLSGSLPISPLGSSLRPTNWLGRGNPSHAPRQLSAFSTSNPFPHPSHSIHSQPRLLDPLLLKFIFKDTDMEALCGCICFSAVCYYCVVVTRNIHHSAANTIYFLNLIC